MRLFIEVDYEEGRGEDVGAVMEAFCFDLSEQDGVTGLRCHGPMAKMIADPRYDVFVWSADDGASWDRGTIYEGAR